MKEVYLLYMGRVDFRMDGYELRALFRAVARSINGSGWSTLMFIPASRCASVGISQGA